MKSLSFAIALTALGLPLSGAQSDVARATPSPQEQEILELSRAKWRWMAEKDVEPLSDLFHENAKFVHMSGTWNTPAELEIIRTGRIWYKQADIHDVVVEMFGDTAIAWNRITLLAEVGGNEVSNEFTVTEVYQSLEGRWKLIDMTFSSVRDSHRIAR